MIISANPAPVLHKSCHAQLVIFSLSGRLLVVSLWIRDMEARQRCYITAMSSPSTMPRVCPRCGVKICCRWRLDTQSAHECWKISTDGADRSWYWGGGLCSNVFICVMNYLNTPWSPGGCSKKSRLESHVSQHCAQLSHTFLQASAEHLYSQPRT